KENLKNLMLEVTIAAEKEGIKDSKEIFESAFNFLINEIDDAKPSMLQDIESGRKTEADIFAGEIIRIGQKYGIKMPYNETVYKKIKELECTAKIRLS
ncbi:MAG: hypothetical protein LUG16_03915, partial [Candidatus Gastranaerophilales bacterium]|nr:hypothetical protein [Candidatus Gastranaerophilales bacterium]